MSSESFKFLVLKQKRVMTFIEISFLKSFAFKKIVTFVQCKHFLNVYIIV